MRLFQTPSGVKKNQWHIALEPWPDTVNGEAWVLHKSMCHNAGGWVMPNESPPTYIEFDISFTDKLCPACVEQAYKEGLIRIVPVEVMTNEMV
jgi:hypothetical protein